MKLQQSLTTLIVLCLFSTTVFAEDTAKEAKSATDTKTESPAKPKDEKKNTAATSEKPVPPSPPKKDADEKKEEQAAKSEADETDLAGEVDELRALVKLLRAELDAVKASRVEEQKVLHKAKEKIDERIAALETLNDEVKLLKSTLTEVKEAGTASQTKLDSLVEDSANVLAALDEITEKDGDQRLPKVLGNLRLNEKFRNDVLKALDVKAEVVLHNNEHKPTSMWVNGTLYRLQPGKNTIRVAYGPLTLLRYTTRSPRVFTNWKTQDGNFVMEFDVGAPAKKAKKTNKEDGKESEKKSEEK